MHIGGSFRWVAVVAVAFVIGAIALGSRSHAVGALSDADKVGIYVAVLDDRYAQEPHQVHYLVDIRKALSDDQRKQISLHFLGSWVGLDDVDVKHAPKGSIALESLYPPVVARDSVTVDVSTLCGGDCARSTRYTLSRSSGGWRIEDQRTVHS